MVQVVEPQACWRRMAAHVERPLGLPRSREPHGFVGVAKTRARSASSPLAKKANVAAPTMEPTRTPTTRICVAEWLTQRRTGLPAQIPTNETGIDPHYPIAVPYRAAPAASRRVRGSDPRQS
jgi:hypothetical protein